MTPAWRYLLWDNTEVTLSSHTPMLAASPLVFVLSQAMSPCPVMYFNIFSLWSSLITNLDFSTVQSVILTISVVVDESHAFPWLTPRN